MTWAFLFLDERFEDEMLEQPADICARFDHVKQLIAENGPMLLPAKYVKHIDGQLWELRLKGKDGIARAFYVTASGTARDRSGVHEEDAEDTAPRNQTGPQACRGGHMSKEPKKLRKMIPVDEAIARWRKDPGYMKEYTALEQEFALVAEVIKARAKAGLTQEQLAKRMNTSQAVVARLESGRALPSTRTLQQFAKATGHRLKISFEPDPAR